MDGDWHRNSESVTKLQSLSFESLRLHKQTRPSSPPVASTFPFGAIVAARTGAACPRSGCVTKQRWVLSPMYQSRTVASYDVVTAPRRIAVGRCGRCGGGSATARTPALCPSRTVTRRNRSVTLPSTRRHTRATPSIPAVAKIDGDFASIDDEEKDKCSGSEAANGQDPAEMPLMDASWACSFTATSLAFRHI